MLKQNVNVEFGKCSFDKGKDDEKDEEDSSEEDKEPEIPPELESIRTGNLYFDEHRIYSKHIPFILAPYASDLEEVMDKVFDAWDLPYPRIVLIAIADTEDSPSDMYRKMSRTLVKGLIHALNTTEMWLCTDGLNHGFSRDIGRAFENEVSKRKTIETSMQDINTVFPETALIGICRRQSLAFSKQLIPKKPGVEDENEITEIKKEINRRFGYFMFLDDSSETMKGVSHFLLNFARHISTCEGHKKVEFSKKITSSKGETPVITLLLQGKITDIDLILGLLKLGLPLVVFEGSGGLADLIAYTYHQSNFRPEGINIAEFTEAVLKPQVSDMMHELYPEFSDYKISFLTEKLFDCIRYSKQRDQEFITVLNLTNVEISPSSLSQHLLKAFFKSQTSDTVKDVKQMKKDMFLAMDWNSPDVAREEVFARDTTNKFQIDVETFFRALTKPQREDFVSLFLNKGFRIHTFLDSSSLLSLFHHSLNREFFKTVVWESFLGFGSSSDISRSFLDGKLIILIEELTGISSLVNSYELDWNCRAIYDDRTAEEAERKAFTVLAMWAILSYRVQLVKTLWRHSEQPVHIALACSIILRKLEAYVTDLSLKNEMDKFAKEFSVMAANVMTLCFESVPCRAIDLLKEKNRIWSYKALMELAAFAKNKMFLAHPCCQKHLDNIFTGKIKIRDLHYGDVTMPLWLKITLSAFFFFPMFLWITIEMPDKNESSIELTEFPSAEDSVSPTDQPESLPLKWKRKISEKLVFIRKIYYFWSAPITKFWVYQVFYLLFLFCFSLAVIWPACGNVFLDFFTCVWIATIIIDNIYHAYTLNIKYTSMPLVPKCLEISLMILFLFGYAMGRIIWKHTFMTPYNAKVMLCLALLYFYYRLIFAALPISSELGPMLYRIKRMITVDFVNFMRVTILIMISNGVAIHAVIYPDHPIDWALAKRALHEAIIAFFLTPAGHYGDPDPKCIRLKRAPNKLSFIGLPENECKVGRYLKNTCPSPGVWPYIFGLQYLIVLRMILTVMLFALFSNTTTKLEEEGKYIWKYQRYELVINFSNRLTLPPPFSVITIIFILFKYLFFCSCDYVNRYILKYSKLKGFKRKIKIHKKDNLNENDFRYWKNLAMQYYTETKQEKAEEMTTRKRMQRVNALADDLNKQRIALRDLEGYLNELQLQIKNAHQYLEGSGLQVSVRERLHTKNVPQIFSRISPYPNTMISRFPVSDNHVSWKNTWTMYDPISFTLPNEDFSPGLRPHADVDIQRKREIEGEAFRMPHFNWNKITVSPGGICFNRESWVTDKSNRTFEYELDSEELPKNPFGRTGLKGRGFLPKWGPNHYIYVVITRWHEKEESSFRKYLDVILSFKDDEVNLPGGYVHTENRYEIIQSLIKTGESWKDSDDMVAFFESLQKGGTTGRKQSLWGRLKKEGGEKEFQAERVKLGYLDEETNTDQAWCEAEVWHFHYGSDCDVIQHFKDEVQWQRMSEENLVKVPIGQASIMHTIAKNMKAVVEII